MLSTANEQLGTALVDVVQPHEVVDDQLAAALEQIDQSSSPSGPSNT